RDLAELGGVAAEPHGAAHVALAGDDVLLVGHGGDDRVLGVGVELGGVGVLQPGEVAGGLDDHALHAEADAEQRDLVLPGVADGADLALYAADAEAAGDEHAVDAVELALGALGGLAVVALDPADVDAGVVGEPAGAQRLGDRQVGVGQVDVLADQGDGDLVGRAVDAAQELVPLVPVDVAEGQAEPAH